MFTDQQKRLIIGLATSPTKTYKSDQIVNVLQMVYADLRSLNNNILESKVNTFLDMQ